MSDSYLDLYNTNEGKTEALINNIYDLAKFKDVDITVLSKEIGKDKAFLSRCKKRNTIDMKALLDICTYFGVSLNKILSFNYNLVAKRKFLDAKKEKLKELRAVASQLEAQIKAEERAFHVANN